MSCLSALSISALFGSIASGASGLWGSFRSCFGGRSEKKTSNKRIKNINSHNRNKTDIGTFSITKNDYRSYTKQQNGNSQVKTI